VLLIIIQNCPEIKMKSKSKNNHMSYFVGIKNFLTSLHVNYYLKNSDLQILLGSFNLVLFVIMCGRYAIIFNRR
jgi:hypothetical protein